VPQVKGLEKQAARSRLDGAGFRVAVRPRGSSREDTDRVLEQSVASGKEAREGSRIVLTVGGGPRVAEVPDMIGLTYSEALGKLERAGYLLGGVEEIRSATVAAGLIAGQDPKSGTALDRGSYVYLTTSLGPPRACYEPGMRIPTACWRKRQANATKCNPATVSGSLS
jgi:eukaryotic-like serine/threonine-protein kinase